VLHPVIEDQIKIYATISRILSGLSRGSNAHRSK
jgi:hypothetical protein